MGLRGKPTILGAATGVVAGLWGSPRGGVSVPSSLAIVTTASFCYIGVNVLKEKFGYDSLDVFGVHGVGGTWGLATGIFCVPRSIRRPPMDCYSAIPPSWASNYRHIGGIRVGRGGNLRHTPCDKAITPLRVTPDEEVSGLTWPCTVSAYTPGPA